MSVLNTPTPNYRKQSQGSPATPKPANGARDWLLSLFRTPTPAYQKTTPVRPHDARADRDRERDL